MRSREAVATHVHRSARVALRLTPAQARRCYGMLRAGGDAWAALIELNAARFRRRGKPIFGYAELCREVAGTVVGELSVTALRSVVKRYSEACLETARRKRRGERARYPRRRKALVPLRWYAGTFELGDGRVRLSVAKAAPECWLRLARAIPYAAEEVRSVTLLAEAGRLYLDVTAEVPVEHHDLDAGRIAGVDRCRRVAGVTQALVDKATLAGIAVALVDERGTSSTCPVCLARVPKPTGRVFACGHCGLVAHRDVVGATNIAARGGGTTSVPALVTHRRAGVVPARRDRRRHLMDDRRRSCPAPGRPGKSPGSRSPGSSPVAESSAAGAPRAA